MAIMMRAMNGDKKTWSLFAKNNTSKITMLHFQKVFYGWTGDFSIFLKKFSSG
jgi:hypothetical protein